MGWKDCMRSKEVINAYHKEWYQKNKERIAKVSKAWRLANPEKVKATKAKTRAKRKEKEVECSRLYRLKNKDKIAAYAKQYREDNKSRIYARNRARKHKMLMTQMPIWANKSEMDVVYEQARRKSQIEGILYHVDHIIPLNNNLVSGLHIYTNLQVIPAKENIKKSNTFTIES
jgi:hypothetical protein